MENFLDTIESNRYNEPFLFEQRAFFQNLDSDGWVHQPVWDERDVGSRKRRERWNYE